MSKPNKYSWVDLKNRKSLIHDDELDHLVVWYLLKEYCFNHNINLDALISINQFDGDDIIRVHYSHGNGASSHFNLDMKDYLQKLREDKLSQIL